MVNLKAQMQQSITALSLKESRSILSSLPQKRNVGKAEPLHTSHGIADSGDFKSRWYLTKAATRLAQTLLAPHKIGYVYMKALDLSGFPRDCLCLCTILFLSSWSKGIKKII